MNAKQVADELENIYWIQGDGKGKPFQQYADFVRQQQVEIEALKAKTLTDEEIEEVFRTVEQDFALTESKKSDGGWRNFPVELGRAILRKAQEK